MKYLSIVILLSMLLILFAGCDTEDAQLSTGESYTAIEDGELVTRYLPTVESTVYSARELTLPDGFELSYKVFALSNGKLNVNGSEPWVNGMTDQKLYKATVDLDTGEFTVTPRDEVSSGEREIESLYRGGELVADIRAVYGEDVCHSMTLRLYDDGEEYASYQVDELFQVDLAQFRFNLAGEGSFDILMLNEYDGDYYIVSNTGAVRLQNAGGKFDISLVESSRKLYSAIMYGGHVAIIFDNASDNEILLVDFENAVIEEELDIELDGTMFSLSGYDYGLLRGDGIYGVVIDSDGLPHEVLVADFVESGVTNAYGHIAEVSPGRFVAMAHDPLTYTYRLFLLEMIPPDEVVEKQVLVLAALTGQFGDTYLEYAVSEYNRTHTDFRIEVVNYSTDVYEEIGSLGTRFTNELMSGELTADKQPDIFYINFDYYSDIAENLAAQGMFADLYAVMDSAGYSPERLTEAARAACERYDPQSAKSIMPYVPVGAEICTLVGRSSDFPDGFTLEDALDYIEDGQALTSDGVDLIDLISFSLDEFVDFNTGAVDFDNDLFRRFCDIWRKGIYYQDYDPYKNRYELLADGDILLNFENNFAEDLLIKLYCQYAVSDADAIGYPSPDGGAHRFDVKGVYAIAADSITDSERLAAAWDFLELRLGDRFFDLIDTADSSYLISASALENHLETEIPDYVRYYDDITRNFYFGELPDDVDPNDPARPVFHLDDKFKARIADIIRSARAPHPLTDDILAIINEELSALRSRPELTNDEIIGFIENRVGVYVSERS